MSSVVDTLEFQQLLEGLNDDNDRQIMTEVITDQETLLGDRRVSLSPFVSDVITDLSSFVSLKCEGIDFAVLGKLCNMILESRIGLKQMWAPMSSASRQMRQGQDYDIDHAREEIFRRMASVVANARNVFHSLEYLTTDDLEYIDSTLDLVVPTSRGIYTLTVGIGHALNEERFSRSTISSADVSRALNLLIQHRAAVTAETNP
ncbi:hypothetical protein DIURU_003773 [Diutina rugosa]|uniref:Uncharacterized protein n=1 Tax=Diutina rugosa TaxID=5481 RepID=A0A642UK21_DIURU|nr:uncharacterized protein DIURU_003773 [Diutina rugosa]KAA8900475.1 hypothetical protein DIURU_003773 [Diutina rugosa]